MTTLGLSADELLSTTRSVRKRLDFDRPVDPALIEECLEFAVQAPTGSNSQSWQFLVVTDEDRRQALGDIYRRGWEAYSGMSASAAALAVGAAEDRADQQMRVMGSAAYLAENFHRVPVMLIPCLPGRVEQWPGMGSVSTLAGIIPSTWSFMLAARERGLGTCWTTIHLMFEEEAAEVLAIPYSEVSQVALITVAHTLGTDFRPATRAGGAAAVTRWNAWD
ncbi:MAG: nitroreductase family protein [Acidimicrobiales bacterium]|nr:nitroreductase family protein [Acidimicrobiales bacterium]